MKRSVSSSLLLLTIGLLSLLLLAPTFAAKKNKNRVLVLLDDLNLQHSHSIFFAQLKSRGYELFFFSADDPTLALTEYGEYLYHQLILFAPTVEEFGGLIDVPSILDFIDDGNNVLLVGDSGVSDPIREIASECGVQFDEEKSHVIDHLNFDQSDYDHQHNLIVIDPQSKQDKDLVLNNPIVLPNTGLKPILFRGIGHTLEGSLNFPILKGSDSAYSAIPNQPVTSESHTIGKTILVSALQARNNARVLISGSLQLFSDRFFNTQAQKYGDDKKSSTGNEVFTTELSKWVFKERGVLKASNETHHRVGESQAPDVYTVKQDITYEVDIEEWNGKQWVPFVVDDVQLEFIMLDPYIRTFLKSNPKGHYKATFKLPDVYGVFTFKVDYQKQGYTSLELITRTPVRPFRHNEYDRFIPTAYPYYAGCSRGCPC